MVAPTTRMVECDILIIGGGMSGCGAAFEAKYWGKDLRVVGRALCNEGMAGDDIPHFRRKEA
jgi:succinate dehydrogenase/fumarate reductase flavoprotein subunit